MSRRKVRPARSWCANPRHDALLACRRMRRRRSNHTGHETYADAPRAGQTPTESNLRTTRGVPLDWAGENPSPASGHVGTTGTVRICCAQRVKVYENTRRIGRECAWRTLRHGLSGANLPILPKCTQGSFWSAVGSLDRRGRCRYCGGIKNTLSCDFRRCSSDYSLG